VRSLDGTAKTDGQADAAILRICRRAGLPQRMWHTLRHSFGTHAALFVVNPWRLQAWMGHKRIDETLLYVHVAEAHGRELLHPRCGDRRSGSGSSGPQNAGGPWQKLGKRRGIRKRKSSQVGCLSRANGGTRTLPRRCQTIMSRVALQSSRRVSGSLRPDTSGLIRVDRLRRGEILPRVLGAICRRGMPMDLVGTVGVRRGKVLPRGLVAIRRHSSIGRGGCFGPRW
jgi:Phage integrase family